jgi:hypothetical protein
MHRGPAAFVPLIVRWGQGWSSDCALREVRAEGSIHAAEALSCLPDQLKTLASSEGVAAIVCTARRPARDRCWRPFRARVYELRFLGPAVYGP